MAPQNSKTSNFSDRNHRLSLFLDVYDEFAPKRHPNFCKFPLLGDKHHGCSTFLDVYEEFGPKWHPRFHKKELGTTFLVRGAPKSSPTGLGRQEPGRPAGPARPPGPRLAGRWAASREGNEGRAQEGEQRAGGDGAPPTPITAGGLFGMYIPLIIYPYF